MLELRNVSKALGGRTLIRDLSLRVEAGDRIGNAGLTGLTTGTHLHWSVWRNGELIDPLSMIGS